MTTQGWASQGRQRPQANRLLATPPAGELWVLLAIFSVAMSGLVLANRHPGYTGMSTPASDTSLLLFLQVVSIPLVPSFMYRLGGLRRVLGQRLLPNEIWPRCLRRSLARLGSAWLLLSLPLLLEAGLGGAGARLLAGPAWLGMGLSLCLWAYAAWLGLIARTALLLPSALLAWAALERIVTLWPAWHHAGLSLHMAGCAVLPLSLLALQRQLSARPRPSAGAQAGVSPAQQMHAFWRRQRQRWQGLDGQGGSTLIGVIGPQLLIGMLSGNASRFLIVPAWGSELDLWHGVRLLFLSLLSLGLLRWRGLHWRRLLAPQAPLRQNLALRLARDSWLPLACCVLLTQLCGYLILLALGRHSWIDALQHSASVSLPLLCDLSLTLMFTLLLRARWSSARVSLALLSSMLACALFAWLWGGAAWLQRGWLSSLAELALALGLLAGARVAWRGADLQTMLRGSRAPAWTGRHED